jgi:hypothetical protein
MSKDLDDLLPAAMPPRGGSGDVDLDDLVAESMVLYDEELRAKKAKKRLAEGRITQTEREELASLVAHYEEARTWQVVANVALVHVKGCDNCGHTAQLFMGWMTEQQHRVNPKTRRLVAGLNPSTVHMPYRVERHHLKSGAQCVYCLDTYIRARQAVVAYTQPQRRRGADDEK